MVIYGLFDQLTWDAMQLVSEDTPIEVVLGLAEQGREVAFGQSFEETEGQVKGDVSVLSMKALSGEYLHTVTVVTDTNPGFLAIVSSHQAEPSVRDLALRFKHERFLLLDETLRYFRVTEGAVDQFAPVWELSVKNDYQGVQLPAGELPYTFVNRINSLYSAVADYLQRQHPEYQGKYSETARLAWITQHQAKAITKLEDDLAAVAGLAKDLIDALPELSQYPEVQQFFALWFTTLNQQDPNASWYAAMEKKYLMVFKPFNRGTTYPTAYMEA